MYHFVYPNVSRKLTTLGPKLAVHSTGHPFAALQTTDTPPNAKSPPLLTRSCTLAIPDVYALCQLSLL